MGSDYYFDISPILGWTVILVAGRRYTQDCQLLSALVAPYNKLLWATIFEMPQKYHTVKALALLCTWPIPSTVERSHSSDSENISNGPGRLGMSEIDPTFLLSGIMMQIAMQTGLHRSFHAQDFIQQTRNIAQAEVEDRRLAWAVCNIVSQRFVKRPCSVPCCYGTFQMTESQQLNTFY